MSRLLVVIVSGYFLFSSDVLAADAKKPFAKLSFLKGSWESKVKLADQTVEISGLTFSSTLKDQFFQLNYTIGTGEKSKMHQVLVGPGEKGSFKAWTFTSDGKSYESTVKVKAFDEGCELEIVTRDEKVTVKFTKSSDDQFILEYHNNAKKIGPLKATFHKPK